MCRFSDTITFQENRLLVKVIGSFQHLLMSPKDPTKWQPVLWFPIHPSEPCWQWQRIKVRSLNVGVGVTRCEMTPRLLRECVMTGRARPSSLIELHDASETTESIHQLMSLNLVWIVDVIIGCGDTALMRLIHVWLFQRISYFFPVIPLLTDQSWSVLRWMKAARFCFDYKTHKTIIIKGSFL